MARTPKPINSCSKHYSKAEKEARQQAEQQMLGNVKSDKVKKAPNTLDNNGKKIYKAIINELTESGIEVCNLDIYLLEILTFAIEMLHKCQEVINNSSIEESNIASNTYNKYFKIFKSCCNDLGLSPSSRAKLSMLKLQKDNEENDPLLRILRDED